MPRITEAHVEARRRDILRAAFEQFAAHGFHRTTMQDVATRAGLSVGALYRYFDGKEALVRALAARGAAQTGDRLAGLEEAGSASALADALAELLGAIAEPAAAEAARLDVRLWAEALDHAELHGLLRGALDGVRTPIRDFVEDARRRRWMASAVDPDAVARVLLALTTGLELQRAHGEDLDVEACCVVVRAMLAGLRA